MTDLPQWAMEKAEIVAKEATRDAMKDPLMPYFVTVSPHIASALVEAEARGIERAAEAAERYKQRPNSFKSSEPDKTVFGWGRARTDIAKLIRKLKDNPNE